MNILKFFGFGRKEPEPGVDWVMPPKSFYTVTMRLQDDAITEHNVIAYDSQIGATGTLKVTLDFDGGVTKKWMFNTHQWDSILMSDADEMTIEDPENTD